jgi:23S rRNA pseudouridine2457 synthase
LKDFIDLPGVYCAGRLDFRSEGLLVLSNHGAFIHRMTDPRYEHPKIYLAQVEGAPTPETIRPLNESILLPGMQSKVARVEIIASPDPPLPPRLVRDYHATAWLRIILYEGKKHQVRRMTAAAGFPTLRLVRVAIGEIKLGSLAPGEWRYLTKEEVASI